MDDAKDSPFQCFSVPIRLDENGGGFDAADDIQLSPLPVKSQPSSGACELTISFRGEVYVFPAVAPQKMQAVLLLLGGQEAPHGSPSSEFPLQRTRKESPMCFGVADDVSNRPTGSHRIASLERFREKRKERCFEKKIRYNCRKEVALRMHRKSGQFASVKGICKTSEGNWGSGGNPPSPEPLVRNCQHCGISEASTPAMRRGPCGPRTLCNACGLMWANKGTLRDLAKGGKHCIFDRSDQEALEIKPTVTEQDISFHNLDQERTPEQEQPALMVAEIPSVTTKQGLEITNRVVDDSSVRIGNLIELDVLEELAKAAGSEFKIPANFVEQVCVSRIRCTFRTVVLCTFTIITGFGLLSTVTLSIFIMLTASC